ncbi:MAG: ribbon-helix-helix protein, CopG family [Euryarchaeota archaeon]|nr:ribbon-helix-helix protein, CopG family [Euryarchaeota archaeon]
MRKVYIATRVEKQCYDRIEALVRQTKLSRAEIVRRLILIGLKQVEKPEDLIRI